MPDLLQLAVMSKHLQFNNSNSRIVTNISVELTVHITGFITDLSLPAQYLYWEFARHCNAGPRLWQRHCISSIWFVAVGSKLVAAAAMAQASCAVYFCRVFQYHGKWLPKKWNDRFWAKQEIKNLTLCHSIIHLISTLPATYIPHARRPVRVKHLQCSRL